MVGSPWARNTIGRGCLAIRLLLLEDSPNDAEFVQNELRQGGIAGDIRWVSTKEAFRIELEQFPPDIIISDNTLPGFSGREALELAKATAPDTPFILVTGSVNEETAVEYM